MPKCLITYVDHYEHTEEIIKTISEELEYQGYVVDVMEYDTLKHIVDYDLILTIPYDRLFEIRLVNTQTGDVERISINTEEKYIKDWVRGCVLKSTGQVRF